MATVEESGLQVYTHTCETIWWASIPITAHMVPVWTAGIMPLSVAVLWSTEQGARAAEVVSLAHSPEPELHRHLPVKAEHGDGGGEGATDSQHLVHYDSV